MNLTTECLNLPCINANGPTGIFIFGIAVGFALGIVFVWAMFRQV